MALSTIGTAAIADDAITSAKVDSTTTAFTVADLVVTNGITAGTSINAGSELVGNVSGRILLDASASGTDVGDEFLLNATDGSASNDGSKILFEEGTDDPNTVLNSSDVGLGSNITFLNSTPIKFNTPPTGQTMDLLLNSTIASAVATFDIDSTIINSTYDDYIMYASIVPATDNTHCVMYVFERGFILDGDKYSYEVAANSSSTYANSNSVHRFQFTVTQVGNAAGESISIVITMSNVNSATIPFCYGGETQAYANNGNAISQTVGGALKVADRDAIINGLRLQFESGNIAAGEVKIYGIVK